MINWKEFIESSFWFEARPLLTLKFLILSGSFFLLLLLLLGFLYWWNKFKIRKYPPKNKFFIKVIWWLAFLEILLVFLIIFRVLGLPVLSARFFWVIFLIVFVFSFIYNFYIYIKKIPEKIRIYEAYQLKRKYLPK